MSFLIKPPKIFEFWYELWSLFARSNIWKAFPCLNNHRGIRYLISELEGEKSELKETREGS